MIEHFPIKVDRYFAPAFLEDNQTLFDLVLQVFHNNKCWVYAKGFVHARNARGAYWALHNHFLGPNNVDNQATAAERKLAALSYHGEKRNCSFEHFSNALVDQFNILNNLKDHGHVGIDVHSQVRQLNDGIKTSLLDPVKTHIMASPQLKNNFEACIMLYKDFIAQLKPLDNRSLNVSAIDFKRGGKSNDDLPPLTWEQVKDVKVDNCYYIPDEYQKLSREQKVKLKLIRKGQAPGNKHKSGGSGNPTRRPSSTRNSSRQSLLRLLP